jgi:thioesterase domain-containing protein
VLPADQGVHAFRMRGLYDDEQPLLSIEQMAAHYVAEMIRVQPEGPYYLGGYSLGGTVAFEMAQQLTRANRQVALLAVLDQRNLYPDASQFRWPQALTHFLANFPWWIYDDFLATPSAQLWLRVRPKLGLVANKLRNLFTGQKGPASVAEVVNVSGLPDRYRQLLETNFRACRAYVPAPYPGRVVLIRARSQPVLRLQERDLGWRGVAAGGVDVRIVPGNHDNLLDTRQVNSVAKVLLDCLR